ncbi:MAG TPA: tetratricopeptide repeat protein [Cytophagaceae bacterium]
MSNLKVIFFLMLLIVTVQVNAQDKKIKSLSSSKLDIYALINKAERVADKDPKAALEYIEQALSISIQEKDRAGEAAAYKALGNINLKKSLYAQSIDAFQKALHVYQELKNRAELIESYKGLGMGYEGYGNYDKAIEHYKQGLAIAQQDKKIDEVVFIKNKIGDVYLKQNKPEEALQEYQQVLKLEEERGNSAGVIAANNNIGNVYLKEEKTSQAREYYEKSQKIAAKNEIEEEVVESYDNIGKTLRKEKKYEDELAVRKKTIEANTRSNNQEALSENYLNVGTIYLEKNEVDQALPYLEKSIELSKKLGKLEEQGQAHQALSKAFKEQGDFKKALEHYQTYVMVKDSILRQKEKELTAIVNYNEELSLKQKRIELLESNRKINEQTIALLKNEQKFFQLIIVALTIILVLAVVSGWMIYTNARKRRIANQILALKSLRSQMNPHFIFNALNSVNNYISKNDERSANKYLSDFSRLMRTVMENSQYEFISLSTELDILRLYLSLEHARFKEKFEYELIVSEDLYPDQIEIPPMLIQPYIENAVWHGLRYRTSGGGYLKVEITSEGNVLKVVVEDNGIGRKKSQELKTANQKDKVSTGLKNTETRLSIINELYKTRMRVEIEDLDPVNETGTKVTLFITPAKLQAA